jgi:hypothetical protein
MPLSNAQEAILHILFSLGMHPSSPLGHDLLAILGHFSQAIPQTPIFISISPPPFFYHILKFLNLLMINPLRRSQKVAWDLRRYYAKMGLIETGSLIVEASLDFMLDHF